MLTTHDLLLKVAERRATLVEEVAEARGVQSWDDYLKKTAAIRTLTEVGEMAVELDRQDRMKQK